MFLKIYVGAIILTLEIIKESMFFADFSSDGRLFHICDSYMCSVIQIQTKPDTFILSSWNFVVNARRPLRTTTTKYETELTLSLFSLAAFGVVSLAFIHINIS